MFALFFCFMDINYFRIRCMKDLPKGDDYQKITVWRARDLTLFGRVVIIKSLGTPPLI